MATDFAALSHGVILAPAKFDVSVMEMSSCKPLEIFLGL